MSRLFRSSLCLFLGTGISLSLALEDPSTLQTLHLNGGASISGELLSEKPDHLVIDVGYTVLMIPKNAVVRSTTVDSTADGNGVSMKPLPWAEANTDKASLYTIEAQGQQPREVRELVSSLGASVVQIRSPGGLGSGFIINPDGHLITNFHVIEGETQISVEMYLQRKSGIERKIFKDVRIVALNKFADLALLQIEDGPAEGFEAVPLGTSDRLGVGERVFAIGSPLGLQRTVTEGILSTKNRQLQGALYLQTTTQINPGNSGGPLFNRNGAVIGVTNMKMNFAEGLGFAIPVETVRFFLDHREAYGYDNDNPNSPYRYLKPARQAAAQGD